MRNKYPGCCVHCSAKVGVGEGYFERRAGRFVVRCMACVVWAKKAAGKPLSDAQFAFAKENTNAEG